ncbi:MAG: hypothetical protein QOF22_2319, partial [Bradyrhizobium sp.]|nr:hypothetical protein [Bradyrhizobium sp.]
INPMVDAHAIMRERQGLRAIDDSLGFKRFRGMKVELLGAARSNLINKRAPRILADEYDAYPDSLGNAKGLLDIRRQTFGNASMLCIMSHCDRARGVDPAGWTDGIMAVYADSDRRIYWWPCPHCGAWSSAAPIAHRVMTLEYPADGTLDEVEAGAYLRCPVNGCVIEEPARLPMMRLGRWIGEGCEIDQDGVITGTPVERDTIGFWILGVMSPFLLRGMGGLARELVKAQRNFELSGDETDLREVTVKQLGMPFSQPKRVGSVDAATLAERARQETTTPLGVVPTGARFITVAADCQGSHFEWLVRGWGVAGESWVIATGKLPGDPSSSPDDWDRLYDEVLSVAWPLADGSGRSMRPRAVGADLNGPAGTTQQAYQAWSRWRRKPGAVRNYGVIGGREAWSVLPLQGANGVRAQRLTVVYPDTTRRASKIAARGEVPVGRFNPNWFKDDLNGQLKVGEPGSLYVHCPAALRSKEPPHLWFEQVVAETRDALGNWHKPHNGVRNEAMDLMVMTHVLAHLHGLSRIGWQAPPAWARPWDENSMIVATRAAPPPTKPDGPTQTVRDTSAAVPAQRRNRAQRLA